MAITAVTKVRETGNYSWGNRTYTETWRVESNSAAETMPAILTASSGGTTIPNIAAAHSADATAKAIEKSCVQQVEDEPVWLVTVHYTRPVFQGSTSGQGQVVESPLDEDPIIDWGEYATQKVHAKDINGADIENSAGDRYDPPIMSDVHYPTVSVTRNEATYDASLAHDMRDSINSSACTICGLYTAQYAAKLVSWCARSATRNGVSYWEHSYRVEFDPDTWIWSQLCAGLYQINAASDKVRCLDDEKVPAVIPMPLNATTGLQLVTGAAPQYTSYHIYKLRNFAVLGLNI